MGSLLSSHRQQILLICSLICSLIWTVLHILAPDFSKITSQITALKHCTKKSLNARNNSNLDVEQPLQIMVLSSRSASRTRQEISVAWDIEKHRNVVFLVGAEICPIIGPLKKDTWGCEPLENIPWQRMMKGPLRYQVERQENEAALVNSNLKMEKNVVLLPFVDTYKNLTLKVLEGYKWVLKNTKAEWIMKVDDDCFVDIEKVKKFVGKYSSDAYTIIGKVMKNVEVISKYNKTDAIKNKWTLKKWTDTLYKNHFYPKYANGAAGHIISRPLAQYLVENSEKLVKYVLEDASIGIWLSESPFHDKISFVDNKLQTMVGFSACIDPKFMVIGHNLRPGQIQICGELHRNGSEVLY